MVLWLQEVRKMTRFTIKDSHKELMSGFGPIDTHDALVDILTQCAISWDIKVKSRDVIIGATKLMHQLDSHGALREPPSIRRASARVGGMLITLEKDTSERK